MGYFERKQEAELALQAAESEYEARVAGVQKELRKLILPREKEVEELEALIAQENESFEKHIKVFRISDSEEASLSASKLQIGDLCFALENKIDAQVSSNAENAFLSIAAEGMQTTIQVPVSREGELRSFADLISNTSAHAGERIQEHEQSIASIREQIDLLSADTPEISELKKQLEEVEKDTGDIDGARQKLQDIIDNPSEEDLAEIAAAEQRRIEEEEARRIAEEESKKARKTLFTRIGIGAAALITFVAIMFGTHIWCFHSWAAATCTEPVKCSICGRTRGEALGHDWEDADCEHPKTCKRCDKTEGKALGHKWVDATCTEAKHCSVCGEKEGEALGHDLEGLSCTEGATCKRCGEFVEATGHKWAEATCTEAKHCSVCGETEGEPLGHTTTHGKCERCGVEIFETLSGSGDDVINDISTGSGIYRARINNSGGRNFVVWLHDSTGDRDLLVNTIGAYGGSVLLGGTDPYTLEVESTGSWTIDIEPLTVTTETEFSGNGDCVTDIFSASSGSWEFTHDGSGNFAVFAYTTNGSDLIVNEIGPYNGNRYVSVPSDGVAFFEISADGNWTARPAS